MAACAHAEGRASAHSQYVHNERPQVGGGEVERERGTERERETERLIFGKVLHDQRTQQLLAATRLQHSRNTAATQLQHGCSALELRRNLNPKPFQGSHPPHDARSPQPTPIRPLLSPFGLFQAGKGGEHHHHGSLPFFVTGFGVLSHLAANAKG